MKILVRVSRQQDKNMMPALLLLPLPRGHRVHITTGAITLRTSRLDKSSYIHLCGFSIIQLISFIPMGFETVIRHKLNFFSV
jgi:hypothetical protein